MCGALCAYRKTVLIHLRNVALGQWKILFHLENNTIQLKYNRVHATYVNWKSRYSKLLVFMKIISNYNK